MDGQLFTFQLKLDRGALLHTLWHFVSKNLVSRAIWPRKPEMNVPRLLYVHPSPFIFSGTSGNGLAANSFAFKSVAAVVLDITLHWVCLIRGTEFKDILSVCWSCTMSRSDLGASFLPLSLSNLFFFFFKNATIRTDISKLNFAACQSGTLSRVSRAEDSQYPAPVPNVYRVSNFPSSPTPTHRERLALKDWSVFVEVSKLGSLHTFGEPCVISHVWWILSQTTFWTDLHLHLFHLFKQDCRKVHSTYPATFLQGGGGVQERKKYHKGMITLGTCSTRKGDRVR